METLKVVSNRLPVSLYRRKNELHSKPSAGGLATGLSSLANTYQMFWIGWPGASIQKSEEEKVTQVLAKDNMKPVFLSKELVEKFYEGFSNKTIWPLFHYFPQNVVYDNKLWEAYVTVNKLFLTKILENYSDRDTIWVHDYQLMLLPGLIRAKKPDARIGFFLHIPFPSFEIFRLLPWRIQLLKGVLGADLVGFHTFDYARHFLSASMRLLGLEHHLGQISFNDRSIKVDSFPMGIDYKKFATAANLKSVKKEITRYTRMTEGRKIILSIDRLDYAKGILQRLEAFHQLLRHNPSYKEQVSLILLVVPSRSKVESYRTLKHRVDELVGKINGEHGTMGWTPIWYFYKAIPFSSLSALYNISDICLVTSFRDGMNLVAKEYVASKTNKGGVLVLSELAGAASELNEALIINPNNLDEIRDAICEAFVMPLDEQKQRITAMNDKLRRYNVRRWAEDFFERLEQIKSSQNEMETHSLNRDIKTKIITKFRTSEKKLILLDYDGTLVGFAPRPELAKPDKEILGILDRLATIEGTEIVLISGRDRKTLGNWVKNEKLNKVAEHGAWIKEKTDDWMTLEPFGYDWKPGIRQILELYVDRTPGSLVEEKDFSLVWHYRKADVGLGEIRARELLKTLNYFTQNLNLQVLEGSKVVEVKNAGINKGRAALHFYAKKKWDFVLAAGDDWTDEDMFKALPEDAFSIKVGFKGSAANYNVKSYTEIRELLNELAGEERYEKNS